MSSPPADILKHHPATRLARLEAENLAIRFASKVSRFQRLTDHFLAAIENRMIERILIRRLRKGITAATKTNSAAAMLSEMRGSYEAGGMETLPSFLPGSSASTHVQNTGAFFQSSVSAANRVTILYTAGGGFMFPLSKKQKLMIQRMAEATNCEIVPGRHRFAPENPFPAAPHDIADQYREMLEQGYEGNRIIIGGDTAGASITLGALQIIQQQGLDFPAGVVLFSPWCDLAMSGWSYITASATSQSPFRMETAAFCARVYLQDSSPFEPVASPVYADIRGWPPILIHTSKFDLHFDDAIKLAEMGKDCDCDVKINYWDSPRHHLERLSSKDTMRSFGEVNKFIHRVITR